MAEPLTVICWLWAKGRWQRSYQSRHVNALARMLERHLHIPYRLVCITDQPTGIDCETYPIWPAPDINTGAKPNCYRRLWMFSKEARRFGERILSIDLDCVIFDDITPLVDRGEDFVITRGRCCPYNGSMWLLRTGTRTKAWTGFDPETSPRLAEQQEHNGRNYFGSDQAWLSYQLPGEPVWSEKDGLYQFSLRKTNRNLKDCRIMFFAGTPKPWDIKCARVNPAVYAEYEQYLLPRERNKLSRRLEEGVSQYR